MQVALTKFSGAHPLVTISDLHHHHLGPCCLTETNAIFVFSMETNCSQGTPLKGYRRRKTKLESNRREIHFALCPLNLHKSFFKARILNLYGSKAAEQSVLERAVKLHSMYFHNYRDIM